MLQSKGQPKFKKILGFIGKWFKRLLIFTVVAFGIAGLVGLGYIYNTLQSVPKVDVTKFEIKGNSNMYANDGSLIWSDTERRRDYIQYKDIPKDYVNLLTAVEDNDYFEHGGFSIKGTLNAVRSTIKEKVFKSGNSRGGSTLTQQLIKNQVFSQDAKDRTVTRKIKEIWLSMQLEANYSKEQIFEWYVNSIELGERSFGANTISLTYFGKPISELNTGSDEDLSKLAIIAGLGQAPSTYNLYDNPEAVDERRYEVLLSAVKHGKMTQEQMDRINKIPVTDGLKERFWRDEVVLESMTKYSAHITAALKQVKQLGYDIEKTPLQIYTTLDKDATDKLQSIVDNAPDLRTDEQQVAATVIDNETGHVIAQVGGRYQNEPMSLNRAIQQNRSTGSSIKPLLDYAPAIEYLGYGTQTKISGAAYQYPGTNSIAYNYGGSVYGMTDIQTALRLSLNTTANRLLDEHIGSRLAKKFMSKMKDLDVKDSYGGSDALGLDMSTADLASGYAALARYGSYQQAQYVTALGFSDGSKKEIKFERTQAMLPSTAYILLKILEGVPKYSAQGAEIPEMAVAMKTGTVAYAKWMPDHAASDVWIAATTKSITTAIWSGYDIPEENHVWDNADTRHALVKQIMRTFTSGRDTSEWSIPENVVQNGSGLSAQYYPTVTYQEPDYSLKSLYLSNNEHTFDSLYGDSKLKLKPYDKTRVDTKMKEYNEAVKWKEELSDDDKKVYNQMITGSVGSSNTVIPDDVYVNTTTSTENR